MRPVALLSLLFGFMGLMLLDGQTFSHAVIGLVCGGAAIACGLASTRRDYWDATCQWEGRIMAALGLLLVIICVVQLPSAYRFQTKFNERSKKAREMREAKPTPNNTLGPTATASSVSTNK